MTESIVLLIVILTTGVLAATPGLLALRRPQGNGSMLSLMRNLSACLEQQDIYTDQIADLQRELSNVQVRVTQQEQEIVSLRNVIVSMSSTPERIRRSVAAQPQTAERERKIRLKELETLNIQIALAEAKLTERGGDVHLETQIDIMRERVRELEALLDG